MNIFTNTALPSQILKASDINIPKRVDRTGLLGRGEEKHEIKERVDAG